MKTIKNLLTIVLLATLILSCEAESITDILAEETVALETNLENFDDTDSEETSKDKGEQNEQRMNDEDDDIPTRSAETKRNDEDDDIPTRSTETKMNDEDDDIPTNSPESKRNDEDDDMPSKG